MVQTNPAVNIPSKNTPSNQWISNNADDIPPKQSEKKNPIHVDVHKVQLIKSPKNFEYFFIVSLSFSKIDPQTKIDVIPYAANAQKII